MAATTASHVDPVHSSAPEEQPSSSSDSRDTTVPADPNQPSDLPKEKMRDFEWGGGLIRKALPAGVIPTWLDPLHVDVDDPRRLPLCWFGVPFVEKLFFGFARRVGLAAYYTRHIAQFKPGDLDTYRTWANMEVWFKKRSGLRLDLHNVWGEPFPILTFWSNHELLRVTDEMWGQACDLLDGMEYGEEYEMLWYLDRSLDY